MAGLIQQSIVVSPGCSIILNDAVTMLMAGEVVREGMLTRDDIRKKLESGFLRYQRNDLIEDRPDRRPSIVTGNPIPGNVTQNPLQGAKMDKDATVSLTRDGEIETREESVPEVGRTVNPNLAPVQPLIVNRKQAEVENAAEVHINGVWDFDPEVLATKDLTSLNLLAGERQPGIAPFTSVEAAITKMSSEHRPTK